MKNMKEYILDASKIILVIIIVLAVLVTLFYFLYMRPRYVVPVLMYHSISDRSDNPYTHVDLDIFLKQMKFLHDNDYSVISVDELVDGIKSGRKFPHKTVVITFDDGYVDNYLYAFPVLSKYKMPATIFILPGSMGEEKGCMTWDQVRLMQENGIEFGSHTNTHEYLPDIKDTKLLWKEIADSKKKIESNTGVEVKYFSYPVGGFNDKIKEAVKKAGYKAAFTTGNRGADRYNKDIYELNRIKMTNKEGSKPLYFRAAISGYNNLFRNFREQK